MYNEWSLDVFYHGVDDPALARDMSLLENEINEYNKAAEQLSAEDAVGSLRQMMETEEQILTRISRIAGYFSLRRSANSADAEGAKYLTKIQALSAGTAKASAMFRKFVGELEDLDGILAEDELLSQYTFLLHEIKDAASHQLSDEAEVVFARMNLSGGRAWATWCPT